MKNSIKKVLLSMGPIAIMVLFLSLISCDSSPEGNYSDGKRWFSMQHCATCHGEGGSGGKAPKIQQTELSYRELLRKVRKPKSAIMPSFSKKQLPDQYVADIFSYLQEEKRY